METVKQALLAQLDASAGELGQVRRMVEAGRPGVEILRQTRAVERALRQFDVALLEAHLTEMTRPDPLRTRTTLPVQELCLLFERSRRRRLGSRRTALAL